MTGDAEDRLARQFEANRPHLRAVAYRMLGSLSEAEDAVQESWLRLARTDAEELANLGGWLTTVVSRVCLDVLRSRRAREAPPPGPAAAGPGPEADHSIDPEREAVLADAVGLALLVVLGTLTPGERVAFVLHDLFDLSFEEIAPVVGRTVAAARQLASRARRRVRGPATPAADDPAGRRALVDAFLRAAREGDLGALLAVLDPDVVLRADAPAVRLGGRSELRGAGPVAGFFLGRAGGARTALVEGVVGAVVAPLGRLRLALGFTIEHGRISGIDATADPARLGRLRLAVVAAGAGPEAPAGS